MRILSSRVKHATDIILSVHHTIAAWARHCVAPRGLATMICARVFNTTPSLWLEPLLL